jgi:YfiH family protein
MTRQAPRDGFEWVARSWGQVLEASALSACADHLFTDRHLQLRGPGSGTGWTLIAAAVGVAPDQLFRPRQVHGRTVAVVQRCQDLHPFSDGKRPQADAVITDNPSCAVAVQVADCVPILIADSRNGAVAAIHAGWRGTAAGVVPSAVKALGTQFGTRPADLVAALGPSIGPCCYQVGPSVVEAFVAAGLEASSVSRWFVPDRDGRFRLNLWAATSDQLRAVGVLASRIHTARLCTVHDPDRFYSYRAEGAGTGRMAAVIRARG